MGDFMESDLDKAVNNDVFNGEIAQAYYRYAQGQTLIFASSVAHAENIAAAIKGAVVVSQKTKDRARIIKDFTDKKIKCLVNCMIFTEGTDLPLIETIMIARPTQNASLYTQMVGRGLRKYVGKRYLTLIDLVGVSKMDICTAPTLMGLDMDDVPDYRRDGASGAMLTQMEGVIEKLSDCPENWVMNVERVRLFAKTFGADTHDVNWSKKANGSLVYQFSCGDRIGIKPVDELGKTKLMRYVFNEQTQKFDYTESERVGVQQALDMAYEVFVEQYSDEENLWDLKEFYRWSEQPATEKQIEYLKNVLGDELDNLTDGHNLTKGDCSQIINMLKLKNASPMQLVRLRKKRREEIEKRREDALRRAAMKIRYELEKKSVFYKKYYALILPDELIITDSWSVAKPLIDEAEGGGARVRYKSFLTLNEAVDFVRK